MSEEYRNAKLEAKVEHLQSDMTEIKGTLKWQREAFESFKADFTAFKIEVAKEFGAVRAEMSKEFGSVRVSIERAKLWMVVTGLGTILSVWGAAFALARFLKP